MAGGDYGRVRHTFWTDPDVKRGLTPDQKLLFLYLMSNPHCNLSGVYPLPLEYAAMETGLSLDLVADWIAGPLAKYVTYDQYTEEVFVHALGRHQVAIDLKEKDRRAPRIVKELESAHSKQLVRLFLERYDDWPLNMEAPSKNTPPEGSPFEAPSKPLRSHSSSSSSSSSSSMAEHSSATTVDKSTGDDPREKEHNEQPEPTPDPEKVWKENRARIAGDIRKHLWRGAKDCPRKGRTMDNELSVAKNLLKQFTPDELCGAMEVAHQALGISPGQAFTLGHFYEDGQRQRLHLAVSEWRSRQTGGADVDEMLEVRSVA